MPSSFIKRFPQNLVGNDYVVADIHGCLDVFLDKLKSINFDPTKDRMFSVGDLVDRGPESYKCLELLDQPWFYAVRGNHEDMAVGVHENTWDADNYIANGGRWFFALSDSEKELAVNLIKSMPLAIEIEMDDCVVGVIHAEVLHDDWDYLHNLDWDDVAPTAMWSRGKIRSGNKIWVRGIDRVYVGHTVLKSPVTLGNVFYLDTGAVFNGSKNKDGTILETELTVVKIN